MNTARVCARCAKIVRPRQKRYTTIKNANPRKKQRCDGGNPCSRCVRLGHICSPQVSSQADSEPQNYRRPRASRSRGGCLSCKARKKKCDEIRPRCSDCRRLNLSCRWRRPPSSSPSPSPSPSHSPHSSAVVAEVQDSTEAPISLSDQITTPSLSTLTEATIRSPSDVLSVASSGPSINSHLHSDEDRSLFNHYFHIVAHVLSRSGDPAGNLFLTAMLPMAAASDTLTSVLLGLSGCHWRRVYPSIWKRALARQGRALAQVNQLLMRSDRVSMLEACATVLLLCLIELCDGTSRVWKWHLKAARTLLTSVGIDSLEATPGGKFCLRLFHYLDSMSTIARCKPPLSQDGKGLAELTATAIPTITTCNDSISGMAPALLEFLGMVNLLAAYRSRRVDELSEIGFRTAATHVQAQLDTWRASYDAAHQEHSVDEDRGVEEGTWDSNTNLATTAFEWAIRLRLHQIVDGYNQRHATVETAISRIMEAVLAIPYGSSVEGILLFPLVIAGASSVDVERRMLVKERLMVMENTVGFGHIPRARELLETVWAEENDCNWAKVRYRQFPGVVFI